MARGGRVMIAKGNKVSFWGDKNGQSLTAMMVTELCEYNKKKNSELYTFKRWTVWYLNYILIKLFKIFSRQAKDVN